MIGWAQYTALAGGAVRHPLVQPRCAWLKSKVPRTAPPANCG